VKAVENILKKRLHKAGHNREHDFILIEIAYKGGLTMYRHNNNEEDLDIENYGINKRKSNKIN
jgi:hypothetical protein